MTHINIFINIDTKKIKVYIDTSFPFEIELDEERRI